MNTIPFLRQLLNRIRRPRPVAPITPPARYSQINTIVTLETGGVITVVQVTTTFNEGGNRAADFNLYLN